MNLKFSCLIFLAASIAESSKSNEMRCPFDESLSKIFFACPPLPNVQSRYKPSGSEIRLSTDSLRSMGICLILDASALHYVCQLGLVSQDQYIPLILFQGLISLTGLIYEFENSSKLNFLRPVAIIVTTISSP